LETQHPRGDVILAGDGKAFWLYSGKTKEFKKGESQLRVLGPTASTLYSALHLIPFMKLMDDSLQSPAFAGEDEIKVGDKQKTCYVIKCIVNAPPIALPEGVERPEILPKDFNPFAGAKGVLMSLQMHGLADLTLYLPNGEKPEAPTITLWIDKEDSTVWRSQIVEKVQKSSAEADGDELKKVPVELRANDTYSIAKINEPLPKELFQFMPPEDAKEVSEFTKP
jgi:hypothetical protein